MAKSKKPKSIARLTEDAAELLQKLVRLKAADDNGYARCVTSGKVMHWTELQGGHFIERGRLATKLLEENVHPQAPNENLWEMKKTTGVLKYRAYMVETYGEDFVADLEVMSRQTKKYTRAELAEIISEFKSRIAEQEIRLGLRRAA